MAMENTSASVRAHEHFVMDTALPETDRFYSLRSFRWPKYSYASQSRISNSI